MGQAVSDQGRRHYKCRKGDDLTSTAGGHDVSVAHLLNPGYNRTMKMRLAIIALLACPSVAMAENYATCLLDALPDVQNNRAAQAAVQLCEKNHPEQFKNIEYGSSKGFLASYDTPLECFQDKAKSVQSDAAINLIGRACTILYGEAPKPAKEPDLFDEFGIEQ